jgi:heavy metal efflux system protein
MTPTTAGIASASSSAEHGHAARQPGAAVADGLEPRRPDLLVHHREQESECRCHGAEVARRLGAQKQFKSVPGVVDVASFGGITKEYQIRLNPDKLISYGLSIAQVEQQLQNNNTNAGGSFIVAGTQQINVQAQGLYENVQQIEDTLIKTSTARRSASRILRWSIRDPRSGSARSPNLIRTRWIRTDKHYDDSKLIDNPDVVEGSVLLQKGADADPVLKGD